jgi:hypothetical protein
VAGEALALFFQSEVFLEQAQEYTIGILCKVVQSRFGLELKSDQALAIESAIVDKLVMAVHDEVSNGRRDVRGVFNKSLKARA